MMTRLGSRSCYVLVVLSLFAGAGRARAQGERNIWYFGDTAGLDFNSGAPVALMNGALITDEGCSSICDANGNLLFYTDGTTVWNSDHEVMQGGTGLGGGASSTQSATIVPVPGDPDRYYLFSLAPNTTPAGLSYSVIDMSMNGGLGEVTVPNIHLYGATTERITVVPHANGTDRWVITRRLWNGGFRCYLATGSGITGPVDSPVGIDIEGGGTAYIGCMRADPYGSRIAVAHHTVGMELLHFDNTTGLLSDPILFPDTIASYSVYGLEFSASGRFLYASAYAGNNGLIRQYDVTTGSPETIGASLHTFQTGPYPPGTLQMGPDGRIYVALVGSPFLGIIQQPELAGTACDYDPQGAHLGGRKSRSGLPHFQFSSLQRTPSIVSAQECREGPLPIYVTPIGAVDTVLWDFDDPASGAANSSTDPYTTHLFSGPGTYNVTATITLDGIVTVLEHEVVITGSPLFTLGNDTSLCSNGSFTVTPGLEGASYLWQDGTTEDHLDIYWPGTYYVDAYWGSCTLFDTLVVSPFQSPLVDLGPDTTLCLGSSITLDAGTSGAIYSWYPNESDQSQVALVSPIESTFYTVSVDSSGCISSSEILVQVEICTGMDTTATEHQRPLPTLIVAGDILSVNDCVPGSPVLLVSADGRLLRSWVPQHTTLEMDLTGIPAGLDFLLRENLPPQRIMVAH